ncbi:16S rRNA (guanine(527)-N(7))-methyltransferase RsmG [Halanaerobaculum tunisiense]
MIKQKKKIVKGAKELGIDLTEKQIKNFKTYLEILQKWNQKINLTALDSAEEIIVKHFLDSLSCLTGIKLTGNEKIIDVGTGAGFPGLPIKIIYPELNLTLLDASQKRISFLRRVCYKLGLKKVEFIHGRAEDYGQAKEYRASYDYALARAVAKLNILAEYLLPFTKVGGQVIAHKGPEVDNGLADSKAAIQELGGQLNQVQELNLPFREAERRLVLVDKVASTPLEYPRQAGQPTKNPL